MEKEDVVRAGKTLDSYANHFVHRDWKVENDHHVTEVIDDRIDRRLRTRIKSALGWLNPHDGIANLLTIEGIYRSDQKPEFKKLLRAYPSRIKMTWYSLKSINKPDNTPDVTLDNGCIVSFWAETGDYLSLVQPSVGDLVAKFLVEEPANPHAVAIAREIQRIMVEVNEWPTEKEECY